MDTTLYGFSIFGIIMFSILSIILLIGLYAFTKKLDIIHIFLNNIEEFTRNNESLAISDVCSVIPGTYESSSRVPSFYLAHIAFFAGFIITNAAVIYNMPKDSNLPESYYDNRINRTSMIIGMIIALYTAIVLYRYNTGCESYLGIFFTTCVFGSIGFGWFKVAELCGARNADILGITTSIVPVTAKPLVCGANAP